MLRRTHIALAGAPTRLVLLHEDPPLADEELALLDEVERAFDCIDACLPNTEESEPRFWLRDDATGKVVGDDITELALAQRRAKQRSARRVARISVLQGARVVEVWLRGRTVTA